MVAKQLWALVASAAYVAAQIKGFNYGSGASTQDSFEADIKAGTSLPNASGFNSVRLYTMIQDGTQNTPSSAIPAAIAAKGTLLLGLWASAGQTAFNNELAALKSAIQQYGQDFADTVVGISVGSEDLYRITYTSQVVNADPNPGADPDTIVSYISQLRDTIKGTVLSNKMVGHVDTYTAFINGSNAEVINACDFLGMDAYPYYESTLENGIDNAYDLFFSAYDQTTGVSNGKPVWVTETGWPHTGKTYNLAVASVANAEAYWKSVGCALFGKTNVWWYTLSDPGANPAFGVLSGDVSSKPLFDLTCDGSSQPPPSSSSSSTSASSSSSPSNPNSSSGSSSNNTPGSSSASGSSPSGTGSGSTPSSSSNAGNSGASSPPSNPPSSPSSPPSSPSSSPSSPSSPSSSPSSSGMSKATLTGTGTGSGTGGPSASSTTTTPSSSSSTGHTNTPSVAAAHRNLELGAGSAALLALLGYFL